MAEVRAVRPDELAEAAALLGRVFDTEAMVTWTFPADSDLASVSERFFGAFHRAAEPDGWVWVVGDGRVEGMAMWVPPDPHDRYAEVLAAIDDEVAELAGVLKSRYYTFWEWWRRTDRRSHTGTSGTSRWTPKLVVAGSGAR